MSFVIHHEAHEGHEGARYFMINCVFFAAFVVKAAPIKYATANFFMDLSTSLARRSTTQTELLSTNRLAHQPSPGDVERFAGGVGRVARGEKKRGFGDFIVLGILP
jgi:hypothetical protein